MMGSEVDYKVFVKIIETPYSTESNTVSKVFEYNHSVQTPNLLFVNTESVLFEYHADYDLVGVGEDGRLITLDVINQNNSVYRVNDLLPNHDYRFAFVEKRNNKDLVNLIFILKSLQLKLYRQNYQF